ncbi:uncharacterized protein C5orf49 homolog isoform X2 [Heterocephalus glaber]|uniref:Uncharacterized protein C5orf49 homolog isoform X2 n=1 Tax=Heterocephalus glaber TaxID=10181 RepID=A0AAX6SZP0_HETGA|nr:uncharacterized protein C5orf49 homolog isoform X2 [Heterocephalus glaber]
MRPEAGSRGVDLAEAGAMDPDAPERVEDPEDKEITAHTLRGRPRPLPLSALSAFSYVPPRRRDPEEHSYYRRRGQHQLGYFRSLEGQGGLETTRPEAEQTGIVSLYDCIFKRRLDYNQKLHRDDREHAKGLGLHVAEEEAVSLIICIPYFVPN